MQTLIGKPAGQCDQVYTCYTLRLKQLAINSATSKQAALITDVITVSDMISRLATISAYAYSHLRATMTSLSVQPCTMYQCTCTSMHT